MSRTSALIVVAALLGTAIVPDPEMARKKKSHLGVFGTIDGKPFKATNLIGTGDYCAHGIYQPASGIVSFYAVECRAKRRRQVAAVKKNYKVLVLACSNFDQNRDPTIHPLEVACVSAIRRTRPVGSAARSR